MCFWSIEFFAQKITQKWTTGQKSGKRYPTPDFHRELWSIAMNGEDVLVICPRGFAKTTAISKILALWLLLFELEKSILVISSKGLGEKIIGDIRQELEENKLIRMVFGDLVPIASKEHDKAEKWRQRYLQLLNKTEIQTLTKGQSVRGQRPTLIIIDDPQEDKDVKNPRIADEFYAWVFTTVYPAVDDGGNIYVLGTIISANCFVNKLKGEADQRGFKVFEYPAILDFDKKAITTQTVNGQTRYVFNDGVGRSLWPSRWPLQTLEKRYNKMDARSFMQEYMNKPFVINGTPVFDQDYEYKIISHIFEEHNFKFFKPKEELLQTDAFVGIDFGAGGQDPHFISIRNSKHEKLAEYRGWISQDLLCHLFDKVVPFFKSVFIVPENNMGLTFLTEAKSFDWSWYIYREQTLDKITMTTTNRYGFNTNAKTKPFIISELKKVMREGKYEVSEIEKDELEHYYYDAREAMNAIPPWHDDSVIANALCTVAISKGAVGASIMVM